ncbi:MULTISPECIES: class II fructose-bisphosphate aldolase [unclassified Oceanobacillus]|uniref:class II fructose-bisphosphate aldolase n=1 Tax=unclassified Oceanobacillus TaxID=2630292 RepID=UPI002106B0DE|nr:class II fructose-bisphosphate aldolase [Oceanobacillus sp. AG]
MFLHEASGISKSDVRKCISLGCAKVNVSTELKKPFTKALRESLIENPNETDIRKYMCPAKAAMKEAVIEKILICKSYGKA